MRPDGVEIPECAVGEANLLHGKAACAITGEEVGDRQSVRGADDGKDQLAGMGWAGDAHIGSFHTVLKSDGVEIACGAVDVPDDVLAIAAAEQVGVVAEASVVVTAAESPVPAASCCITADEDVVVGTTIECIVAVASEELVVAGATNNHIVISST